MSDVGDWRVATLTVVDSDGDPGDATTAATLTVVAPDGTTSTPATATADDGHHWTAAGYEFTAAGEWIERWTVTGKGAGKERTTILVAPDPTAGPSGQRVYATTEDLANWLRAAPPAGSRRALAEASRDVDQMLLTAVYDVDDDGLPTDADVIAAMRDATCAQAEYARALGDPTGVGAGRITQAQIGSVSFQRSAASGPAGSAPSRYSPQAWQILQQAGLTGHEPLAAY